MARNRIDPTCRYGHGPMVRVPSAMQLEGVAVTPTNDGLLSFGRLITKHNGNTLTLSVFWCQECGYTELQEWSEEPGNG